ncbi:MAG: bifunctional ADP-dependent NAD(P)H-hydrate dehydratase/NAD(P)H-hydrate epimerase [Anaerolineae bacterium]
MIPVVSVEQMRRIEAAADANGLSYATLMENAGRAVAERALQIIANLDNPRVTILVGKGNNGGDGLVAGRYLAAREDADVRFYLLREREADPTDDNVRRVQEAGLFLAYAEDDHDQRVLRNMVASADLVIDALFGIGVRLPIQNEAARLLRGVNQALNLRKSAVPDDIVYNPANPTEMAQIASQVVLAVDCPSGLDCDTGALDPNAIHAHETMTFIALKPGLLTYPGAEAVGKLRVATLGVTDDLPEMRESQITLATARGVKAYLPARPSDSNKGTFGKALVVAGSLNYSGAAGLAAQAAYRSGAGLVTVGAPGPVAATLAAQMPEPTWLMLSHDMGVISDRAVEQIFEQISGYHGLLLGPGWGQEDTTGDFLKQLLEKRDQPTRKAGKRSMGFGARTGGDAETSMEAGVSPLPPLVIDADGLNLLGKQEKWWALLPENTIITPHPGEMARLSGLETSAIQADRWRIAQEKAAEWQVILLLKGAHTLIAAPDGRMVVLPFKNDALATAGTGDVLAGLIAGLLAQGAAPFEAAVLAGYLHGLAGEQATALVGSGRGVIASDVLSMIPAALGIVERS